MSTIDDTTTSTRSPGTTWLDRMLARLHAHGLDARLAHDADPDASPLLAARAAWLVSTRHRAGLADEWLQVLGSTRGTGAVLDTRAPVARAAVRAAAPQITALADALRGPSPVDVATVARARRLLTDGTSAVYAGGDLAAQVAVLTRG
ncbi:hypothetical protein [Solicola sp. PLA-1-18]|uniref:hypothetical protein n=1 Tax=Solicola sp. PLA-1-18 TaxID=3380532 RepID=UPI003B7969CA